MGEEPFIQQAMRVCEGMFCPSLGSQSDYVDWFERAGLKVTAKGIWTNQVKPTGEICRNRVERTGVHYLAKVLGKNHVLFLDHVDAILNAYNSGAMEYGTSSPRNRRSGSARRRITPQILDHRGRCSHGRWIENRLGYGW